MTTRRLLWILCCIIAVSLLVLTFTPVIIPQGQHEPELLGMPYTLWTGILLSMTMVGITFLATLVHPGREETNERKTN